jgi:hypothetical protein
MRGIRLFAAFVFIFQALSVGQCPSERFTCWDCGMPLCWNCGDASVRTPPTNETAVYCYFMGYECLYCDAGGYPCRITRLLIVYACDSHIYKHMYGYLCCDYGY